MVWKQVCTFWQLSLPQGLYTGHAALSANFPYHKACTQVMQHFLPTFLTTRLVHRSCSTFCQLSLPQGLYTGHAALSANFHYHKACTQVMQHFLPTFLTTRLVQHFLPTFITTRLVHRSCSMLYTVLSLLTQQNLLGQEHIRTGGLRRACNSNGSP